MQTLLWEPQGEQTQHGEHDSIELLCLCSARFVVQLVGVACPGVVCILGQTETTVGILEATLLFAQAQGTATLQVLPRDLDIAIRIARGGGATLCGTQATCRRVAFGILWKAEVGYTVYSGDYSNSPRNQCTVCTDSHCVPDCCTVPRCTWGTAYPAHCTWHVPPAIAPAGSRAQWPWLASTDIFSLNIILAGTLLTALEDGDAHIEQIVADHRRILARGSLAIDACTAVAAARIGCIHRGGLPELGCSQR